MCDSISQISFFFANFTFRSGDLLRSIQESAQWIFKLSKRQSQSVLKMSLYAFGPSKVDLWYENFTESAFERRSSL